MTEVASKYGLALFSLASDSNNVSEYTNVSKQLIDLFKENPDFLNVLNSAFLPLERRKEILKETIKGIDEEYLIFLYVVLENHRITEIIDILEGYISYANESKGIKEGLVYSVTPLSRNQVDQLSQNLSKKLNKQVDLKNVIDKSLIGGVKVVLDGHVYDGSLKYQLDEMKAKLISKEGVNDENKL